MREAVQEGTLTFNKDITVGNSCKVDKDSKVSSLLAFGYTDKLGTGTELR